MSKLFITIPENDYKQLLEYKNAFHSGYVIHISNSYYFEKYICRLTKEESDKMIQERISELESENKRLKNLSFFQRLFY